MIFVSKSKHDIGFVQSALKRAGIYRLADGIPRSLKEEILELDNGRFKTLIINESHYDNQTGL